MFTGLWRVFPGAYCTAISSIAPEIICQRAMSWAAKDIMQSSFALT